MPFRSARIVMNFGTRVFHFCQARLAQCDSQCPRPLIPKRWGRVPAAAPIGNNAVNRAGLRMSADEAWCLADAFVSSTNRWWRSSRRYWFRWICIPDRRPNGRILEFSDPFASWYSNDLHGCGSGSPAAAAPWVMAQTCNPRGLSYENAKAWMGQARVFVGASIRDYQRFACMDNYRIPKLGSAVRRERSLDSD
jgi:hypothetical protein